MDEIKNPFKVVKISGEPRERGYQYGSQCADLIKRLVESHYSFYSRYCNVERDSILNDAAKFIPFIENYSQETSEEMKGIAEGADVKHVEIVMLTAFPELYYPKLFGTCTAFAVGSEYARDGDVYVGQNEDEALDPWLEGECSVLLAVERKTGPSSLIYTYAGIPAMKGVNSSGIALCINALICEESKLGVPSLVITREVMYSERIGDALRAIYQAERASSLNFVLADKNSELYDIEATPMDTDYCYSHEYLAHSNHFLYNKNKLRVKKDYILQGLPDTVIRYNRMGRLLETSRKNVDLKLLMSILRDHVNYPNSICRHVNEKDRPQEKEKTLDSIIFVPSKSEAWFAKNPPCQGKYYGFGIDGRVRSVEG